MFTTGKPADGERWSEGWLRAYLSQPHEDLLAAVESLVGELRDLAQEDLAKATNHAWTLYYAAEQHSRSLGLHGPMPWLTSISNLTSELVTKLERHTRPRMLDGAPNTIYLEERLREIDPTLAAMAANSSEAVAWRLFHEHGLVNSEEYEQAQASAGRCWTYTGT
jgi:hypothetical protein